MKTYQKLTKVNHGQAQQTNSCKKYYIPVNGILIEVDESVYKVHARAIANERARARRDHKCGQPDFRKCHGDCGQCPWQTEGTNMLSYQKAFGAEDADKHSDLLPNIPNKNVPLIEDIVADRQLLADLFRKMDELVPDGGRIIQMLVDEYSEREIAHALGISSQSTINYRMRKLKKYLREHWNDFFGD